MGRCGVTLPLTIALLAATYDVLLLTPPFRRWKMPSSVAIRFRITRSVGARGAARGDHTIEISSRNVGRLDNLIMTMAHEMVHVHNHTTGHTRSAHGAEFRRCADLVCKHHGFDPQMF